MKYLREFLASDTGVILFSILSFGYVFAVLVFYPNNHGTRYVTEYTQFDTLQKNQLNPSDELNRLREQVLNNPSLMIGCHNEAHKIGHKAYDLLREDAFMFVDPMCGGGYLHGVLEEAFLLNGLSYLDEVVHNQCDGEILESCLHGVGHGIHELTKDLVSSIEICATISASSSDCYDGVYMDIFDIEDKQNIVPPELDVAQQICEVSPELAQQSCYFYLPRVLSAQEPGVTIKLCSSTLKEKGWAACANGSGVYFMKHTSNFNREIAEGLCDQYTDLNLRTLCSRGADDYQRYGALENKRWH